MHEDLVTDDPLAAPREINKTYPDRIELTIKQTVSEPSVEECTPDSDGGHRRRTGLLLPRSTNTDFFLGALASPFI